MNKKLSGAEFKKRAAKRLNDEKELLKKVPKIGCFFKTPSSTSPSSSNISVSSSSTSTVTSAESENVSYPLRESDSSTTLVEIGQFDPVEPTQLQCVDKELCSEQSNLVPVTVNLLSNEFLLEDPGTWKTYDPLVIENIVKKSPKQNLCADFSKSERVYADQKRTLSLNFFKSVLPNGETYTRDWLLFSASTGKLYCIPCCLFQPDSKKNHFCTGFNDWKHGQNLIKHHEQSADHRRNILTYITRQKNYKVSTMLSTQYEEEVKYWQNVLSRVVSVVKFLAVRGLPFRGDNETLGSTSNGLYLGCLELISEYDPFLAQHIKKYGSKGSGHVSYLSANTCNEFIDVMGNIVLQTILNEIRNVLYYSLIVDSTPDCSHTDQLAIVLRYVSFEECEPKERLIKLLPGIGHSSSSLEEAVIHCLSEFGLDIKYLRGQSFDNASNMSGAYTGLQARIRQHNPLAEFVPCAGHSLNLVGSAAAECCTEVVKFFSFIQELYNFFSVSTHRWEVLKEHLDKNQTPVVKSLSDTRWSARADALKAVVKGYKEIQKSLNVLSEDPIAKPGARLEAQALEKQFQSFETAFLCILWNDILERVDKCSNNLQKQTMHLSAATKQIHTLEAFIAEKRDEFDKYEQATIALLGCETPTYNRIRKRKIFPDETGENEVEFDGRSAFRIKVYLKIIDSLKSNLSRRKKSI